MNKKADMVTHWGWRLISCHLVTGIYMVRDGLPSHANSNAQEG